MKLSFLFLLSVLTISLFAQPAKDTSFTAWSDFQKIKKSFPEASPFYYDGEFPVTFINAKYKTGSSYRSAKVFLPPPAREPGRVIIMIHGGGWRSGSPEMEQEMASSLASRGYVTVLINYSLSPEAKYPAALNNISDAFYWLCSQKKIRIDTSKIAFYGCSSGGHLAVLSALQLNSKNAPYRKYPKVRAVIDIDGVLDLTVPAESGKDTIPGKPSAAKQWLGYAYKDKPALWKKASPINYIDSHSPVMLFINSSIPRFHAGRDSTMHLLKSFGIYSEVFSLPETPHTFWLYNPWAPKVINKITGFLQDIYVAPPPPKMGNRPPVR